jgi:MATE family multidrug resistance protein
MEESRFILRIMIPMMLKFYFSCAAGGMAVAFIGHYDKKPENIAGALLGKAYSDITGLSIGIGITLGLSTCISQNHGRGADNENGFVLKQCRRALCVAMMFSIIAALFSKPILQMLGQPIEVLGPCQRFAITNLISLPGFWFAATVGTTMVSMNIVNASVFADTLSALLNMVCTFVFLRYFNTGYIGAAWANVIAGWSAAIFIFFYVKLNGKQDIVWTVPPRTADTPAPISLRKYLSIAIPSAFSLWAEWWAGQVLAIFAGWLPAGEMAVGGNGIIFNTLAIFYMTFVATQAATTTRVGNLVGMKQAKRIPISIVTAVALSVMLSGAAALALQIWGKSVLQLYTDEQGILQQAFSAKLGMVLSIVPYAVMMCLLGALRGAGLQTWGAIALAVAFYVVGLPASAYLAMETTWELLGIWLGNALGMTVAALARGCGILWVNG